MNTDTCKMNIPKSPVEKEGKCREVLFPIPLLKHNDQLPKLTNTTILLRNPTGKNTIKIRTALVGINTFIINDKFPF